MIERRTDRHGSPAARSRGRVLAQVRVLAPVALCVTFTACATERPAERAPARAASTAATEPPGPAPRHLWPAVDEDPDLGFYCAQPEVRRADVLFDEGRWQEAVAAYDEALDFYPKNPYALANRAGAKRRLGDLAGAIADYTSALELRPDYTLALHNRGYARHLAGDHVGALADLDAALEVGERGFSSWTWSRPLSVRWRVRVAAALAEKGS